MASALKPTLTKGILHSLSAYAPASLLAVGESLEKQGKSQGQNIFLSRSPTRFVEPTLETNIGLGAWKTACTEVSF
jgi:hypothetical protein